jgi:hypothetical protein
MKYLVPICALLTISCTGILDGKEQQQGPVTGPMTPVNNNTAGTTGAGGTGAMTAATPFGVRTGTPELLPFDVRVRRVANALSVPITNPMFADMMSKNIQLGDYDHAHGALPDNLWLARRIATWSDSLTLVCASPEMKALFPALPENMPQLIKAAWGRVPTAEETAEFNTAITEAALPANESYEATCMTVFTAAEFVFR